ncbi:MAG: hypothetical protein GY715_09600 [Planctomycetes bacterium]|nr:hypothetical protein [Planctomycetota bacterium]
MARALLLVFSAMIALLAGPATSVGSIGNIGGSHTADDTLTWAHADCPTASFADGKPFTIVAWLYQEPGDRDAGQLNAFFHADDVCRLAMDYGDENVQASLSTAAGTVLVEIDDFTTDGTSGGALPAGAWILTALSWEEPPDGTSTGTATLRCRSDAVTGDGGTGTTGFRKGQASGAAGASVSALGTVFGFRVGGGDTRHWTGIRSVFIRNHAITDSDFDDLWESRSPTAPYELDNLSGGGTLSGPTGHIWNGGIFHPTSPYSDGTSGAVAALPGDLATDLNIVTFNADAAELPGSLLHVRPMTVGADSTFRVVDVFDEAENWSGFFSPRVDDSLNLVQNTSGSLGDNAERLALQEYTGVVKCVSWAHSRAVRTSCLNGRTFPEQYSHGFTAAHLEAQCGGFNYPIRHGTRFFGQDASAESIWSSGNWTLIHGGTFAGDLRSFQRFWSGGGTHAPVGGSLGPAGGAILRSGTKIQIVFHPEEGTLLTHTDDATLEIYVLQHGGDPEMTVTPVKSSSLGTQGTPTGSPVVVPGPTIVLSHTLSGGDVIASATQIALAGDLSASIQTGQLVLIQAEPGETILNHAINKVESVTGGPTTIVTFEHPWPTAPEIDQTLQFAEVQVEKHVTSLPGLDAIDEQDHRGIVIENSGTGIVVVFANSFWIDGALGEIHGPAGWGGAGYVPQLAAEFSGAHERMFELLAPEVVFSFAAGHETSPEDWPLAVQAVRGGHPDSDIILISTRIDAHAWDLYATDDGNTAAIGVYGMSVRDHPDVGDFAELCGRFANANTSHFSAEGNRLVSLAAIDLMAESASCTPDLDGDDSVGFSDVLVVIGAWGCTSCPDEDLNGNGIVDFADLLVVISGWGICP